MKNKKNMPIIVVLVALISLGCLSLGVSYSYVFRSKASTTGVVITTGDLTSTVEYVSQDDFMLQVLSDADGITQSDYALITVNKNNPYTVTFDLNIGYAVDSLAANQSVGDLLPMEYIKYGLFRTSSNGTPLPGPTTQGYIVDLPISKIDTDSNFRTTYRLFTDQFGPGDETSKYALKVWIDENTPTTFDESLVYLSINVSQEPMVNKTYNNITFAFNRAVGDVSTAGKWVNFFVNNNNVIGEFDTATGLTVNNLSDGIHALKAEYNGNTYYGMLRIATGATTPNLTGITSGNCTSGNYLPSCAYTYYSTVGQILRKNALLKGKTNQPVTSTYNVPGAYLLGVPETIGVNNVTVYMGLSGGNIVLTGVA